MTRQFPAQGFGQADDAALGGGVVSPVIRADLGRIRGNGHDPAPFARHHVGERRLDRVKDAGEIHVQHLLPGFGGHRQEIHLRVPR